MTEPEDPTTIDWPERQARALIKFEVEGRRPVCPVGYSWVARMVMPECGRNGLPLWGENPHAAALVTCTYAGRRWVLLVQRPDDGTWAMPSGPIEPDEFPYERTVRELERLGLFINIPEDPTEDFTFNYELIRYAKDEPRWVPDPRGSMEAWVVLVPVRFDLGEIESLPEVRGGKWWEIPLINAAARLDTEDIFPGHREILAGVR